MNAGSRWRHATTGRVYTLLHITNIDASREGWPVTVVYKDENERVWSRPLNEWKRKMCVICQD